MALARKYFDNAVSSDSAQNEREEQSAVTFSGSSLFTSVFKREIAKQATLIDEAYSKKIKGITDSQILSQFSLVYDSTKDTFARINEFVDEVSKCEYSDNLVTIKITKGASLYLKFAQASSKPELFSFVKQSSDVASMSDLFSQIETKSEFSCDSIISLTKSMFASMRMKCTNSLKKFVEKWVKHLDEIGVNKPVDSTSSKPVQTQAKTKPKRTSTTESTPKSKSKPKQEKFWGLLVGYTRVDDSTSKKFVVIKISDSSVIYMSNRLKRGKSYVEDFYKAAESGESGAVVPVMCYNWYENYSDSYCVLDYYVEDDYAEFESTSGFKVSDMQLIVDDYIKSCS